DLGAVLARDADRQPAVRALLDVIALLEAELVDVEVERLVLVQDVDRRDVEHRDHRVVPPAWFRWGQTQPAARLTRSAIRASSVGVSSVTAYATGQSRPSSRRASSLKPIVAKRVLNLSAGWKWHRILPSLA